MIHASEGNWRESVARTLSAGSNNQLKACAIPPRSGKALRGYPGVRSKRIGTPEGEHRLIYRLLEKEQEVFIILVGPREEIYEILRRKQE